MFEQIPVAGSGSKTRFEERHKLIEKGRTLEDEMRDLVALLDRIDPPRISPKWIEGHDIALFFRLRRLFKKVYGTEGRIDWSLIVDALPEKWQQRWQQKKPPESVERSRSLEDEIADLLTILEKENPRIFNPAWIQKNNRSLYQRLRRKLRDEDGQIDWPRAVSFLGDEWKTRWSPARERSLEEEVRDLTFLLERESPSSFGPNWIARWDNSLYVRLTSKARGSGNRVVWARIIDLLDEKWRQRWRQPIERNRSLEEEVLELILLLEKENPSSFGSNWIAERDGALYGRLILKARGPRNRVAWTRVIDLLDEKWRQRWQYKESLRWEEPEKRTLENEVLKLSSLLEIENPAIIGPRWIENHDQRLYFRLQRRLQDEKGHIDWKRAVSLLDDKWQQRWRYRETVRSERGERVRSLQEEAEYLIQLLDEKNPSTFSPKWIEGCDPKFYHRLRNKLPRDDQGRLNWLQIINLLDGKWQKCWEPHHKQLDDFVPKEQYADISEVNTRLTPHKNKLYTLISLLKPEDAKVRDAIALEFVKLAQKGNTAAEAELIELLSHQLQEWMDRYPDLAAYKHDPEKLKMRVRKCIYFFDPKKQQSFMTYLRASMLLEARGMRRQVARSLDQPLGGDDDRTLMDVIEATEFGEAADVSQTRRGGKVAA